MRVRFLQRTVYDTNGPGKGPIYEKDSVHEISADEAERWFRRGAAVEVAPEPVAEVVAAPVPEPVPEKYAGTPSPWAKPMAGRRPQSHAWNWLSGGLIILTGG